MDRATGDFASSTRSTSRASDVPRFAALGVIASMQPYHAIDDGRWAERVIGPERAKLTYAVRSLLDAGARVAFGSDWFVAPPTPLEGIYAAVTRRTLDGQHPGGWVPEQRITVEEALRAYTRDAAFASYRASAKRERSSVASSPTSRSSIATSRESRRTRSRGARGDDGRRRPRRVLRRGATESSLSIQRAELKRAEAIPAVSQCCSNEALARLASRRHDALV